MAKTAKQIRQQVEVLDVKVHATFSRGHNNRGTPPWHLTIGDDESGTQIIELRFTDEQFSQLMGSAHVVGLPAELTRSQLHGKTMENDRRVMPLTTKAYDGRHWEAQLDKWQAMIDKEGRGWGMDRDTSLNRHRRAAGGKGYEVIVRRWV